MNTNIQQRSGFGYFFFGLKLATRPGIRQFVLLPLLTNILLVGGALYYLFSHLDGWIVEIMSYLPSFLDWLSYVLWPLMIMTILATFTYFFSTLANFIAAPFNGLLAEKVEEYLIGEKINDDGLLSLLKDTPRILAREWRKLIYVLPKAIGLFVLLLIPGLGQTVGPVLWFIFTAWVLAIQYCDYPFDNHKIPFNDMRYKLKQKQGKAYGFGALVAVFTTIPLLNLIVMPVAVCGATAFWVAECKD
ncbi:sulfate transporter CysZ [Vibrio ostreicida]|uniref:Sulfate transporter CysZ n=1 Tax=Vibrio ostreicida TaxID=526588 RepID=A0ABT8BVV7_9VIBR|nr:sulfate transporter CysZ [Vibrio ostreicida]MDN3609316.1 sulfate transporter CysZ [Vibrio ostreicida]MDN3611118.1 sulfate transporter CysZ [Vibrio ostreicida]NPD08208.1 sulfate transporter CysZ [Vibrio ostreicida]